MLTSQWKLREHNDDGGDRTGAGARASLPHGFDRRGRHHHAAAMGWARRASNGNSKIAFRQCKRRLGFAGYEPQTEGLGYYVMATRESAYPPSWRWQIVRRGKPMGVRIDGGGFTTYEAARLAGSRALADFLEQVELESFRPD